GESDARSSLRHDGVTTWCRPWISRAKLPRPRPARRWNAEGTPKERLTPEISRATPGVVALSSPAAGTAAPALRPGRRAGTPVLQVEAPGAHLPVSIECDTRDEENRDEADVPRSLPGPGDRPRGRHGEPGGRAGPARPAQAARQGEGRTARRATRRAGNGQGARQGGERRRVRRDRCEMHRGGREGRQTHRRDR